MVMFGNIKKYCIIISVLFSVSGFAEAMSNVEITRNAAVYAMLSYLNDISEEKVEALQLQYVNHADQFKKDREKEIEVKRGEKLAELNHLSTVLEERRVQLNQEITLYNNMVIQVEAKVEEESTLRDKLNQAIQRLNKVNELKDQVIFLVAELNGEIRTVNQNVSTLDTLQKAELVSLHFYKNKGYLSDESLVQLKQNLREWLESTDREWELKITSYNNKVMEFQQWQQSQLEAIAAQRAGVNLKIEELNQFDEEINIMITEYNQERETRCKTKECEENILNKKNQIEEKKAESARRQTALDQLMSDLTEKEIHYNTEQPNRVAELTSLREEMGQFSQNLSAERLGKEQELEERIQVKDSEAKEQWEKDKAALDQFQASLKINYGDYFDQFVGHLSHWARVSQTRFESFEALLLSHEEMDQMQSANQNLCEYSHTYPSEKSKQVCDFVTQVYTLLEEMNNIPTGDPIDSWREELNALSEEVITLQQQVEVKKRENDLQRFRLRTQMEEYNVQLPQREKQYRLFSKKLTEELNEQLQQIHTSYQLKDDLLIKEYELLVYILYQFNAETTDVFFSKKNGFLNALLEFMSNIPDQITGFPKTFVQPNEIFSTILLQEGWDVGSYPDIPLSSTVNRDSKSVIPMENEDKKHIAFSWVNTSFISEFLVFLKDRFSGAFEEKDKDVIMADKEMFFKMLFLKGVYRYLPIRQVRGKSLVRYDITFNERAFWILPEGVVAPPKGVYR